MRLTFLTLGLAALAGTTPALAQTSTPLTPSPAAGFMRQPLAPTAAGHAVKSTIDGNRRLIEEQKRLERIMTICIGC